MDDDSCRVALITGGTSGLGKATAAELARRGWSLCLHHLAPPGAGEQSAEAIRDAIAPEAELLCVEADLSTSAGREQLVEEAIEGFGRVDLLVNASAGAPRVADDLLDITEDAYREVMDAELTATFFLTQLVAGEMVRLVESGMIESARIVTLNSISAEATSVDHSPHCLSRAALAMMTRLFADRLGEDGIGVFEIRVGLISAGPADAAHERYDTLIERGLTPIRRWGRPGDVARAVAAVAEDLLCFSTGQVINVDGGFHLRRL